MRPLVLPMGHAPNVSASKCDGRLTPLRGQSTSQPLHPSPQLRGSQYPSIIYIICKRIWLAAGGRRTPPNMIWSGLLPWNTSWALCGALRRSWALPGRSLGAPGRFLNAMGRLLVLLDAFVRYGRFSGAPWALSERSSQLRLGVQCFLFHD